MRKRLPHLKKSVSLSFNDVVAMLSLHHSVLSYVFKKDLPKPSTLPDFFKLLLYQVRHHKMLALHRHPIPPNRLPPSRSPNGFDETKLPTRDGCYFVSKQHVYGLGGRPNYFAYVIFAVFVPHFNSLVNFKDWGKSSPLLARCACSSWLLLGQVFGSNVLDYWLASHLWACLLAAAGLYSDRLFDYSPTLKATHCSFSNRLTAHFLL
mmetsp:Transcript_22872/g.59686  ORF Transcript_22872/g.59686 Transcript_22872/m.59686 type:complete len:207 (-) Transcript_22872:33-653(-)